ncbi:MAG: 3-hydroxyacyl-[acyl-carrier-protein] dehydratase [Rickettsiales bacterium]|jgi:3-hydroxyacyl-[acyl-carrier-protein] dehydratase
MKVNINIEQILKSVPHRYPILLVDKIIEMEEGKSVVGIKNVTFNEPHFMGHFPDKPIMPGVLIIEAMAQTASVMVMNSGGRSLADSLVYFMSIDNAKFRKPVIPGDVLELHIEIIQNRGAVWKMSGIAKVEGVVVAQASFSAMVVDKEKQDSKDK